MLQENKPLFSIIVPAYNVAEYLPQCIESILSQSFHDYELVLVDDGSTDRTGEICDQYQKSRASHDRNQPHTPIISQIKKRVNSKVNSPLVQVIHQSNAGLSVARNTGVAKASGEYLIFVDGDDYLEENALKDIQNGLEPGLDLLRYQAQEVFTNGKKIRHEEKGFSTTSGIEAFKKLAHYYYTENAWLYAYRREFFISNNFQYAPGCLAEDLGLTPLIIARAKTVKAIPNLCYNYRQRSGSIMHDATKLSRRISDILKQFQHLLPEINQIPGTEPILHYLVVSFLSGATRLNRADFLKAYQSAKSARMLQYIHPTSLKSLPRSILLKHFPNLFYQLYRN